MPAFLNVLKLHAVPALTKDMFNEVEVQIVAHQRQVYRLVWQASSCRSGPRCRYDTKCQSHVTLTQRKVSSKCQSAGTNRA